MWCEEFGVRDLSLGQARVAEGESTTKGNMALAFKSWCNLPEHVLVNIFSYLRHSDRAKASLTCQGWNVAFQSPYLWQHFSFLFYMSSHSSYLKCVELYGKYLKSVYIELDQAFQENRENACSVLTSIAALPEKRLKYLKFRFTGENPCFYAGKEFVLALMRLFGPPPKDCRVINPLQEVDLSALSVAYDDSVLDILSANNQQLTKVNIQNTVLVCKVTTTCILRLVQRCRKLEELHVFNCSMSEDILLALTEDDRYPLDILAIACRREEKYGKDLSADIWKAVVKKLPNLRVTLVFDHTCPLHKVSEVMKPEIPVSVLRLETFTYIYDEVNLATSFYHRTLKKIVLQTPLSRNSPELNKSLIHLAQECKLLTAMHVFCVLDESTIEAILAACPRMRETGKFTLRSTPGNTLWVAGPGVFDSLTYD